MTVQIQPICIGGSLHAPPSKSMAHRLLICAALADGSSVLKNVALSDDISATIGAAKALGAGVRLHRADAEAACISGTRPKNRHNPAVVDCRESGSTLRFFIPLFALSGQSARFTGSRRLFERPLNPYETLFAERALPFRPAANALEVAGPLQAGAYALAGDISSQFVSGLLFALPLCETNSTIRLTTALTSKSYVEATLAAQRLFGVFCRWEDERTLHVPGAQRYTACDCAVEGDWSQAAVAAVVGAVAGSVRIRGLLPGSVQGDKVILEILTRAGAGVSWQGDTLCVDPAPGGLVSPGRIDLSNCPDLGPILCTLAAFCRGETQITGTRRLRIKESDRAAAMEEELSKLGVNIRSVGDTISITGGTPLRHGATVCSHNDHRIAMALSAAALCAQVTMRIQGAEAVNKSWPGFFSVLEKLGAKTAFQ